MYNLHPAISGYVILFPINFQVQSGAESFPPYGAVHGSWAAYDMQRAQGHMN